MAEQLSLATIKNVVFLWVKIAEPTITKSAKDAGIQFNPKDPYANSEWTLNIAIPEKTAKALKKKFKNPSNMKNAKDFTIAEFNEQFFKHGENVPDFGKDVTDVVVIKFSQKCRNAKDKDQTRPEVIGIKGKVQDTNGLTVNADVLIGNGSLGHLQVRPVDFEQYGIYMYPQTVCITHLVEYHRAEKQDTDYSAFGMEELDELDEVEGTEEGSDNDEFDEHIPF